MLTLIPTPLGNINDLTFRTIETLKSTELILCEDTRVTKQLLKLIQERFNLELPDFEIISFHEHNQKDKIDLIANDLRQKRVAYLSDAGMPAISDPGQFLVEFCQREGIEYDVLPGASVPPLIYAASGFERGRFAFYGFLPKKGRERSLELEKILNSSYDTIIYEAPHRLLKLIEEIVKIDKNRELFLAKELTKKFQKYFRGRAIDILKELKEASIKGEWALVIKGGSGGEDRGALSLADIENLDIQPKIKAKLISKITKKSVKECYENILKNK